MAETKRNIMLLAIDELTKEELELRILRNQAHREGVQLQQAEQSQAAWEAREAERHRANRERQGEMRQRSLTQSLIQTGCRHRQGGFREQLYRGGGKPCVTKFIMPDGVTAFYQCSRCRLKEYTPHLALQKREPALYAKQKTLIDKLEELFQESSLDYIKGPTFMWTKDGIPFVPEMVGAITDQKGY